MPKKKVPKRRQETEPSDCYVTEVKLPKSKRSLRNPEITLNSLLGYRCRRELMQDTRHLCTAVLQTHGPASALYRDACALRMRLWAGMAEREADLTAAELALDTHDSSLCLAALTDLHETAQDLAAAVVPPGLQAGPVSH